MTSARHGMTVLIPLLLLMPLVLPHRAFAQRYSARRNEKVVRLEDAEAQTVISILPSAGNVTFEMIVKGQNILRWPFASVAEFKARPAQGGIPFLAPWANRLDEPAFYANGRKYAF